MIALMQTDFPDPVAPAISRCGIFTRSADRKSTRLNSSHGYISYAVFCLKKKKSKNHMLRNLTTASSSRQVSAQTETYSTPTVGRTGVVVNSHADLTDVCTALLATVSTLH